MDYEKKYNAALMWMRSVYPTLAGAAKEDAESFFPELKESEDERMSKIIRLALLSMRESLSDLYSSHNTSETDLLEWLKRQKATKWSEKDDIGLNDALWCIDLASKNVTNENQMGVCWSAKKWVESLSILHWKPTQFELFVIDALATGKAYASDYEAELKHLYNQLLKLAES